MSKKRRLLVAHVDGERVDDELHLPSQGHRGPKKSKRRDGGGGGIEATKSGMAGKGAIGRARDRVHGNAGSSSSGDDEGDEIRSISEDGGDEIRSISEDGEDLQKARSRRHYTAAGWDEDLEPAHNQSIVSASALSLEDAESRGNQDADEGNGASESDEALSEDEETEETTSPRSNISKGDAYDDSSRSSISGSDGEFDDEEETHDGEQSSDKSTAFGRAFQKIMKKKLPSTTLMEAMGPILSSHKQLVTKKLEEAAEGKKIKTESKKAKQILREKGHTVPASFPVAKEKDLLKLATRGVVKLFNAVSKAQNVQEAAVSKASEAKEVEKRSKSTFLAMLQGGNGAVSQSLNTPSQSRGSKKEDAANGQPGWSALQDTFMLGKSRLKDWDKKEEDAVDEAKGSASSGDDSDSSD